MLRLWPFRGALKHVERDLSGKDECPFCASLTTVNNNIDNEGLVAHFVYCQECSATGPIAFSESEARALWRIRKLTLD